MPLAYPESDHCDGRQFFNPHLADAGPDTRDRRGFWQLLQWQLRGERPAWPAHRDNTPYPPPPEPGPGQACITFIGHASFLIRLPGMTLLTDPVFSHRASPFSFAGPQRVRPPGLALAGLPRIDLILLSHNHYDHADLASLRALQAAHAPRAVTTLGNGRLLAKAGLQASELDWWDSTSAGPVTITATPARHFSRRTLLDGNRALWGGFMIGIGGARILFAGDSGAGPHWATIGQRLGAPDIALLPIGAYEPRWLMAPVHMNPAEAVQAHLALGARQSIGMHFGTFRLTDEAIDAPAEGLDEVCRQRDIENFMTLDVGETRVFELP